MGLKYAQGEEEEWNENSGVLVASSVAGHSTPHFSLRKEGCITAYITAQSHLLKAEQHGREHGGGELLSVWGTGSSRLEGGPGMETNLPGHAPSELSP